MRGIEISERVSSYNLNHLVMYTCQLLQLIATLDNNSGHKVYCVYMYEVWRPCHCFIEVYFIESTQILIVLNWTNIIFRYLNLSFISYLIIYYLNSIIFNDFFKITFKEC